MISEVVAYILTYQTHNDVASYIHSKISPEIRISLSGNSLLTQGIMAFWAA